MRQVVRVLKSPFGAAVASTLAVLAGIGAAAALPASASSAESIKVQVFPATGAVSGALPTGAIAAAPSGADEFFMLTKGSGSEDSVWQVTAGGMVTDLGPVGIGKPVGMVETHGSDWMVTQVPDSTHPPGVFQIDSTGTAESFTALGTNGDVRDLTIGSDGDLYVSDNSGNVWQDEASSTPSPKAFADGATAFDAIGSVGGKIWLTDDNGNLYSMTLTGSFAGPFATGAASQYSHTLTAGADGNLYAVDGGLTDPLGGTEILQVNPSSGSVTGTFTASTGATITSVTTGSDGNVWFTDDNPTGNEIGELNPGTGQVQEYAVPSGFKLPAGNSIAIEPGPGNTLWFAAETSAGAPAIGEVSGLVPPTTTTTTSSTTSSSTTTSSTTTTSTTGKTPPTGPGTLKVSTKANVSSNGIAALSVDCKGATGATCSGKLSLTYTAKTKGHKAKKTVGFGSARYRLIAVKITNLSIKLSGSGKSDLASAKGHKLKVTATIKPSNGKSSTSSVTLIGSKTKSKHKKK
jgi:hypothetical protein